MIQYKFLTLILDTYQTTWTQNTLFCHTEKGRHWKQKCIQCFSSFKYVASMLLR